MLVWLALKENVKALMGISSFWRTARNQQVLVMILDRCIQLL
jgi:hypothetical protein